MPKVYQLSRADLLAEAALQLRLCKDVRRQKRLMAMRLAASGQFTAVQIAEQLGISRRCFFYWMQALESEGVPGLLRRQHGGGRHPRLSGEQIVELEKMLLEGAVFHGWENNLWTTLRVRELIKVQFGIQYSRGYVWHILTEHLNWLAIRPVQQDAQRNDLEIAQWKAEQFPRIEQEAGQRNASLVFVDETGFMMTPVIRRTFAPRGSKPVNKVHDPHGRISVIGAIIVGPNRAELALHYFALADNVNFRGPTVIEFLSQLKSIVQGAMTIIWDQVPSHYSNLVVDYLKTVPDIVIEFFPAYAPELNPVDRLWRYLKHGRLANYAPPTKSQLRGAIESEMKQLQGKSDLLCSFIHQSEVPLSLSI